jgi:hypothetical protein
MIFRRVAGRLALACLILAVPLLAAATPITYNFSWSGTGGYSMTGSFTFDSASAADGAIRNGEVTSLFFEGFLNGVSFATNSNANTLPGFNFNFDTVTGQFFLGGPSNGPSGQLWNFLGTGLGFGAGNAGSTLTFGAALLGGIDNPVPLTATLARTVPEPATLAILGIGLAGLGFFSRRKLN